jgi:hypothetical protein
MACALSRTPAKGVYALTLKRQSARVGCGLVEHRLESPRVHLRGALTVVNVEN